MNPTENALLEQTLNYGFILAQYNEGVVCYDNLKTYLQQHPPSHRLFLAYRMICTHELDSHQYVTIGDQEIHLVSILVQLADEYGAIYVLSEGDCDLHVIKNDPTSPQLSEVLIKSVVRTHTDIRYGMVARIICNITFEGMTLPQDLYPLVVQCNSKKLFSHLEACTNEQWFDYCLNTDHVNGLYEHKDPQRMTKLIGRWQKLAREAPLYWEKCVQSTYRKLVDRLKKEGELQTLTRNEIQVLSQLLPGIYPTISPEFSDLAYKICLLSDDVRNYILGFPIHRGIPSDEMVTSALMYLSHHGKEEYAKLIRAQAGSGMFNPLPEAIMGGIKMQRCNTEDVMQEAVLDYNLFDRLTFFQGTQIFTFTRVEFESLIKTDKNHWTNTELPPAIQLEVKSRVKLAKKLNLPSSAPILDLLHGVEKDTLYPTKPEARPSSPSRVGTSRRNDDSDLLSTMLMARLLSGIMGS